VAQAATNAALVRTHQWIGEEIFQVRVMSHTLSCQRCQEKFLAWAEAVPSFEFVLELVSKFLSKREMIWMNL
jgi:hypothetical protein